MGSRLKRRRHQKDKGQKAGEKPDDYFAAGPFEFARFGTLVVSRSRGSTEDWKAAHARMAAAFPSIVAEIDELVGRIADRVSRFTPERLLHRAWGERSILAIGLAGDDLSDFDKLLAARMVDYVQSVIASVPPKLPYVDKMPDEEWAALSSDIETLFSRLALDYQIARTASLKDQDPNLDMELEEFRFRTETVWMNVRGDRYQVHERQALVDVLTPHSDVLVRLFGISAPALIDELDKILIKQIRGLHDVLSDMEEFRHDVLGRMSELIGEDKEASGEDIRSKVFEDANLSSRRERIGGEFFGLDLFDVEKVTDIPKQLLGELTWSPGEDDEFFALGEFRGWPLRQWPIMKRPFIRLGGRVLCFDASSLFDNIYRVLQRIVCRLEPAYRNGWNDQQKAASEALPFKYLRHLLPAAHVYQSVFYDAASANGSPQWCECDGLLIYDDHLFIVEVKAGAFTYTSPATDLGAHLRSLQNLVKSPAVQGKRFLAYLESAPEVLIFDAGHSEINRLRRSDFRKVTVCALTLDAFTELAARGRHLRKVGVDVGEGPVWVLSIDDLRMYADLFDNPLVFLHFVEERMRAAQSEFVDLTDEMDHLGLYIAKNDYSQYAADLMRSGPSRLTFDGYRKPIDDYYSAVLREEPAEHPKQTMPTRIAEIVEFLGSSSRAGRSELASFLLDASSSYRRTIANAIEEQLTGNASLGRLRPLSTYGNHAFTLCVWSSGVPRNAAGALEHTRAVLAAAGELSRFLVELEYSDGAIVDAHWQHLSLEGLTDAETTRVRAEGDALRGRRVNAALAQRKIRPNEQCPCGSAKKYKRCCRP